MINAQILAQLTSISQFLEKIEKPNAKRLQTPQKLKRKKCKASKSTTQIAPTTSDSAISTNSAVSKASNPIGIDSNRTQMTGSYSQDIPQLEILRQNAWFHAQKQFRPITPAESYADVLKKRLGATVAEW